MDCMLDIMVELTVGYLEGMHIFMVAGKEYTRLTASKVQRVYRELSKNYDGWYPRLTPNRHAFCYGGKRRTEGKRRPGGRR